MKIDIVMGFFLPVPARAGGAMEKIHLALATRFAGQGHDTTIYSRRWIGLPNAECEGHLHHHRLPGADHRRSRILNLWQDLLWSLRILGAIDDPDIIVTNSVFFPILYKWLRPRQGKVIAWIARMPKGQIRLYGKVDRLIAPSEAVAQQILTENPGLRDRILRIPNPIDWARLATTPRRPSAKVTLGYVGRIHPEKNLATLLDAISRLPSESLPDWELILVGPSVISAGGGGSRHLQDLRACVPPELAGRVRFLPPEFDPDTLAAIYAGIDIFCYPSKAELGEALSLAPLEAMAAGAVPVLSHLDCYREFIVEGENGFLFNHASPEAPAQLGAILSRLIRERDTRNTVATAARKTAQNYDYNRIAHLLLLHFSAIMKR